VLVNEKEATLAKLNILCGVKHNVFGVRMPKKRIPIRASTFGGGLKDLFKDESKEARRTRVDGNIKSKILSHFFKGKISLTPMENILIILGELEYLKVLSN
jgi:hypothetical protein